MNIDEIMEILPHRKPMLLVDEAILEGEGSQLMNMTNEELLALLQ